MPIAALIFSLLASLLVWLGGKRDTTRSPQVTAVVIAILLAFPLLSLLPKFAVLPAKLPGSGATPDTGMLLQWIWMTGAFLLTARVLLATFAIERWRSRSRLIESVPLGRRRVEIRSLSSIKSPVAAGVLRPVVFVPDLWISWRSEDREMVLAHELAHHCRLDPLWRSLGALACALHWFNPLVWWLVRHHATQAEFACDAMVVRNGFQPRCYASLLCDLASTVSSPLPAAAIAEQSSLAKRVTRLMNPAGAVSPAFSALLIGAITIAAITMAVLQRAESTSPAIPTAEIQTRLSADPFPGNP